MKNTNKKAFTLVELLVVIAIIAILFVVLISKVDFATDKAKATGTQTDFRSFQMAAETVAREHAGFQGLVADGNDGYDYSKLEAALNESLDKRLEVSIDATGKITLTQKDSWGELYVGQYYVAGDVDGDGNNDHRGYMMFKSGGANLADDGTVCAWNAETNKVEITLGDDDYAIAIGYALGAGYGEVVTTTAGFSSNQ